MTFDLRAARVNRGLTIGAAAQKMGVEKSTLWRAESGDGIPRPRNAVKIAKFYGLQVTDIWPLEPIEEASAA